MIFQGKCFSCYILLTESDPLNLIVYSAAESIFFVICVHMVCGFASFSCVNKLSFNVSLFLIHVSLSDRCWIFNWLFVVLCCFILLHWDLMLVIMSLRWWWSFSQSLALQVVRCASLWSNRVFVRLSFFSFVSWSKVLPLLFFSPFPYFPTSFLYMWVSEASFCIKIANYH